MMFQPLDIFSSDFLPSSVEEVVNLLYEDLSVRDRALMSQLSERELDSTVYLALAKTIRKEFGLYNRNDRLISSCRSYLGTVYDTYEDPAMIIIKELWKKIKQTQRLRLIKG